MQFVVTLPAERDPRTYAMSVLRAGADLLEVRNDISSSSLEIDRFRDIIPLLVSRRTSELLPADWISSAALVDQDIALSPQKLNLSPDKIILSFHAGVEMSIEDAFEMWNAHCRNGEGIKHIEPFTPGCEDRLKKLRKKLWSLSDSVTVLPMGKGATETRRELARENAFHYCALQGKDVSAPGQALIAEERNHFELAPNSIARAGE